MIIENTEVEIENVTTNVDNAKKEPYQLSSIISPIFGLNHQKITTIPINIKKADSSSSTIEQYVDKKTKENIFREKEVAYNNSSNLDNTRIAQIKKNREQQQIYDSLPSRYLEFCFNYVEKYGWPKIIHQFTLKILFLIKNLLKVTLFSLKIL
ncbi:hypothetical protein [Spiroplasma endosymbiont of Amphimallon solstitiale]|uniref:hypothetical protein n=1 Tax=Spiroplasma endosymbiont of Amphimallon solstitiale TaxID=3066288 RepID=UPI00313CD867